MWRRAEPRHPSQQASPFHQVSGGCCHPKRVDRCTQTGEKQPRLPTRTKMQDESGAHNPPPQTKQHPQVANSTHSHSHTHTHFHTHTHTHFHTCTHFHRLSHASVQTPLLSVLKRSIGCFIAGVRGRYCRDCAQGHRGSGCHGSPDAQGWSTHAHCCSCHSTLLNFPKACCTTTTITQNHKQQCFFCLLSRLLLTSNPPPNSCYIEPRLCLWLQ